MAKRKLNLVMPGKKLAEVVDALGHVLAEAAKLGAKEKALKQILKAHGDGSYSGVLFDATVSTSERDTLDMDAVRAKLSAQFIQANTDTTQVITVRVVGRVRERKAA